MVNKFNLRANKMCRRPAACAECTKNCVLVHRKKNRPSSVVNRFFKIIHGKNYSQVLYLPPKFARTVSHLVGQKAEIEDSSGERLEVTFSNVNGSLAFKEGWHEFFSNHNLEVGDMLMFNYMKKGHFIVHIFDKSACESYDFTPRRPQNHKRCKPNPIIIDEDDSSQSIEKNSKDEPSLTTQFVSASQILNDHFNVTQKIVSKNVGKSQMGPTYINLEEDPICMVNRDVGYPEEDRIVLHDLSNFEMKQTRSDFNGFEKSLEGTVTPPFVQTECVANDTEIIDGCFTDQFQDKPSDNGNGSLITAMQEDANKTQYDGGGILTSVAESPIISSSHVAEPDQDNAMSFGFNYSSAKQAAAVKKELVDSREKVKTSTNESLAITSGQLLSSMLNIAPAKQVASVKKELVESREEAYRFPQTYHGHLPAMGYVPAMGMKFGQTSSPAVKIEPDLSYDTVPSVATSSFCAQVKNLYYLELPVCIPWSVQQKREMGQGRVVFLRDPSGKLWPVLHPDLFYVRAFTGNWRSFCEANHVRPGDVCEFQPESHASSSCIYRVDVQKSGQCFGK